jgi:hypothetical protein
LYLYDHAKIRLTSRPFVVELDHFNPTLEKASTTGFVAPKADSSKPPKTCSSPRRNASHQGLEVSIPGDDDGGHSITDCGDDRIWYARREKVPNIPDIMPSLNEKLSNGIRYVLVD